MTMNASTTFVSDRKKNRVESLKLFLPAVLGTIVEYYDYALYGFFAVFLAKEFFPTSDPSVALIKTFGVFVAGSLSKPIGALIFGSMGDRIGRGLALKVSIVGIAIPTMLIGLMPTYSMIGWLAPSLLLLCRIFQGIFVSGEADGVRIFIFESVGQKNPNFANSLTNFAAMLGFYLASLAAFWVSNPNLPVWIWRVPFVCSGIFGLLLFWYRSTVSESILFKKYINHPNRSYTTSSQSTLTVLIKNKRTILAAILLFGAVGGGYHFYFTFLGSYLSGVLNSINSEQASFTTSNAVLIYTLFGPIAGLTADKYGTVRVFKLAAFSLLGLTLLNAILLYFNSYSIWIILSTASVLPFFHAPGFIILINKFKIDERYRCISFGHSMGSMIFSGSAPLVGLWISQTIDNVAAPFLYFACLILMGYFSLKMVSNLDINYTDMSIA